MPTIFDNIQEKLLPTLQKALEVAYRADFCIGYFNLLGWRHLSDYIDRFTGGEENCCRILIGMTQIQVDWRVRYGLEQERILDGKAKKQHEKNIAEEFRLQLVRTLPTNESEKYLKQLVQQLKAEKIQIKLFLKYPLHAKLYLAYRQDKFNPQLSYLGSSNLTYSGLAGQGELNIDVETKEANEKLKQWFEERWNTRDCIDISNSLIEVIEQSWVEQVVTPYEVYLKIAYHLSQDARISLDEFMIPREFRKTLFSYQATAIQLAARHLERRGGVLLADVVGLGKTLMATVLAKIFEDVHRLETLIICPKNLMTMWKTHYCDRYLKMAHVLSISEVIKTLPELKRYHLVIIDESHNLRNQEGKRYQAIRKYLFDNDSKVILLSATPYNKTYLDLASQLALFIDDEENLGIRPEKLLKNPTKELKEKITGCSPFSLKAFSLSEHPEDWRELMRLYMVRRTRSFIQDNYAEFDKEKQRRFLALENNEKAYFPSREPKTLKFSLDKDGFYAHLYQQDTIDLLSQLHLPRYGVGQYVTQCIDVRKEEQKIIDDLNRGGKRLMGFYRTNLFKRLESSEQAFFYSVERHILRNFVMLHALENNLPVPFGSEKIDANYLASQITDKDEDLLSLVEEDNPQTKEFLLKTNNFSIHELRQRAGMLYKNYQQTAKRFRWLAARHFSPQLAAHLHEDAEQLLRILEKCQTLTQQADNKLNVLIELIQQRHPREKILIFTQFADTAFYLEKALLKHGISQVAAVTGESDEPSLFAECFSPRSNQKTGVDELRILIATDVLSEGQNLQDAAIVVNYDLPWAIVRLIQRVGRVDRIGQQAERILCYSFLPAEGVEKVINLRQRLQERLLQNAEVIGTDEAFFEDDVQPHLLQDLYNEKSSVLEDETDKEVDLISEAYAVWSKAIKKNPSLEQRIKSLPHHVHTTKAGSESGAIVYLTLPNGNETLALLDAQHQIRSDSPEVVLRAAACMPDTPALVRQDEHFERVKQAVDKLAQDDIAGGGLGRTGGIKSKIYHRLISCQKDLFHIDLSSILNELTSFPLYPDTSAQLHYMLKNKVRDEELVNYVTQRYDAKRWCITHKFEVLNEPRVICTMGLVG